MNKNNKIAIWVTIAIVSIGLNGFLYFRNANGGGKSISTHEASHSDIYTCPMHPQVVQDHPGDCPICGMKLVKKVSSTDSDASLDSLIGTVNLSPTQELLANISTEYPRPSHFENGVTVTGTIREIDGASWKASVRAMGRIEKLYVSNAGETVNEGDPIFDLYSPDIASATQEYLYVIDHSDDDTSGLRLEAVRTKLLSLGLEFEHLEEISRLHQAFDIFTFHAPRSGVVMKKMASEGEWVMPAMNIVDFLDLSTVYVEGAILERDAARVKKGAKVEVSSVSGETGSGTITLLGPMADMMTRTIPFRATLSNPGRKWTPGSFVTVSVGGSNQRDELSLPEDAVLLTGKGAVVWVKIGDGRFEHRSVVPGARSGGRIAIMAGLDPMDEVAVTGAYLIDSDAEMSSLGSTPMPGMDMSAPDDSNPDEMSAMPGMDMKTMEDASSAQSPQGKYSCPMHPEVVSDEPGRCPKCGMFLVEKED